MGEADHAEEAEFFSRTIRQARKERGLTEEELAACCEDLTPEDISRLETGELVPRLKVCRQLARALELDETMLCHRAYQEYVPEEERISLRELSLDEAFRKLLEEADKLSPAKRDSLAAMWRETLELLQV